MCIFFKKNRRLPFLALLLGLALDAAAQGFPASWSGIWAGELKIYTARGEVQRTPMMLEMLPLADSSEGRYSFGIIYGSREQDYRPYELVPVAPERGLWRVDEKNSIVMESYLLGPKFLCWFTVQDSRILCSYEKVSDDLMIFEVMSGAEKPVSVTGATRQGEEDIPEVRTYPFAVFQRAELRRQ